MVSKIERKVVGLLGYGETAYKNMRSYVLVFLGFIIVYALFLPLIPLLEPNPYPAVGNAVFYSTSKAMEFFYFAGSFILFLILCFILYKKKVITFEKRDEEGKDVRRKRTALNVWQAIAIFIVPVVLLLLLFANHEAQPRTWYPDWFHEGEVTVHQDKPFFSMYKDYYPFKNVLYSQVFSLLGVEDLVRGYFPLAIMVTLSNIALYFLFLLVFRLIKGSYSLIPALVFFTLFLMGFLFEMNDRPFFFFLFLAFLVASLIYGKRWLFFLGVFFLSVQCLVSVELAIFGGLGLLAFLLVRAKSVRDFFIHAGIAVLAFLPLLILLVAHGQFLPFISFAVYQSKTHLANGAPFLWPSQAPYPDSFSVWHHLSLRGLLASFSMLRFLFVWLILLFVSGLLLHDVLLKKRRDATTVWLVTITVISIIIYKTGFGQESHLYIPAKFAIIAAFSYFFAKRFDFCIPALARKHPVPVTVLVILIVFCPTAVSFARGGAPQDILMLEKNIASPMAYDGHYRAYVPVADRDRTAHIEALAKGHSIFFFSDEPYFNHVLKKEYLLRNPLLFDINTEAMLISETDRLKAWSPDLIVWQSGYKSNDWMEIRNPPRYYVMAGWILANYEPYVRVDDFFVFKKKGLPDEDVSLPNMTKITIEDVFETYHLRDFPYNVGRSDRHGVDFTFVTLTEKKDTICTLYFGSFPAFDFNAYEGAHRYAFYLPSSPAYLAMKGEKTQIACA